ncbi:hypothetical protein G7046_g5245 [Stylonectria norvegica]|nr:hypothetical protein G7046_g5245 [Stylonectria norvegica]
MGEASMPENGRDAQGQQQGPTLTHPCPMLDVTRSAQLLHRIRMYVDYQVACTVHAAEAHLFFVPLCKSWAQDGAPLHDPGSQPPGSAAFSASWILRFADRRPATPRETAERFDENKERTWMG